MSQPTWKLVADLGDSPFENDAYYIYFDTTGVYGYEAEHVQETDPEARGSKKRWSVHRFSLDRFSETPCDEFCVITGEWFHNSLDAVAKTTGTTKEDLTAAFCSEDFKERARAWRCVGDYHGYDNLDQYPLSLTKREVKERYKEELGLTTAEQQKLRGEIMMLALLPLLFSFACGIQTDAVGEPPTGHNIWIIGDAVECKEQGDLANVAEKDCAAYGQLPFPLAWTGSCDVWYIGIAGPYAIPGYHFLTFECL
jgi:hypothetical protein